MFSMHWTKAGKWLNNAMAEDKIYVLLVLDFWAAFGTIDYQIFLSRLETVFGICSPVVLIYLLDRNQCVVVNNSASSSSPVMFGVPQGSVLGPVLFVLYTTPLSDIIASQSTISFLQTTLNFKKAWMCKNQLKVNKGKTKTILFSTPSLSSCHCLPSSVMVGTHENLFSDKVRNLGFIPWL